MWTTGLEARHIKPAPLSPRGVGHGKAKAIVRAAPGTAGPRVTVHASASNSASPPASHLTGTREARPAPISSTISGTSIAFTDVERSVREISPWFLDDGVGVHLHTATWRICFMLLKRRCGAPGKRDREGDGEDRRG